MITMKKGHQALLNQPHPKREPGSLRGLRPGFQRKKVQLLGWHKSTQTHQGQQDFLRENIGKTEGKRRSPAASSVPAGLTLPNAAEAAAVLSLRAGRQSCCGEEQLSEIWDGSMDHIQRSVFP